MQNQRQTSLRISIAAGLAAATVILSTAEPSRPGGAPVETPFVHPSQSPDWELTFEDEFSGALKGRTWHPCSSIPGRFRESSCS